MNNNGSIWIAKHRKVTKYYFEFSVCNSTCYRFEDAINEKKIVKKSYLYYTYSYTHVSRMKRVVEQTDSKPTVRRTDGYCKKRTKSTVISSYINIISDRFEVDVNMYTLVKTSSSFSMQTVNNKSLNNADWVYTILCML